MKRIQLMGNLLADLRDDLRLATRQFRSRPTAVLLTVAALTLGIGVSTAVFSIFNAVLLHGLRYRDPDRLVMLWNGNDQAGLPWKQLKAGGRSLSYPEYRDWRNFEDFEHLVVFMSSVARISKTDDPELIHGYLVTPGVFGMLGVRPLYGRGFAPEEEIEGQRARTIVLQHAFWKRRFHGDVGILNKTIHLDNEPCLVAGIMPPDFVFFNRQMDYMGTANISPQGFAQQRGGRFFRAMARLKQGVSLERAQSHADALSMRLGQQYPETNRNWRVNLVSIAEDTAGELRPAMWVLLAGVGCVLLICFANTTNLLLVQAAGRFKELALRSALGAGWFRLIRQFLAEGFAFALPGGVLGFGLAWLIVQFFQRVRPDRLNHGKYMPQSEIIQIDGTVALFAIGVTLVSALVFGLIPGLRASRVDLNEALKDASRGSSVGKEGRSLRNWLVGGEVTVTVVLVVGAVLLLRSFLALYERGPGYRPENLVCMEVSMSWEAVEDEIRNKKLSDADARKVWILAERAFRDRLYQEVGSVPGLDTFSAVATIPLSSYYVLNAVGIEGRAPDPKGREPQAIFNNVRRNYFQVAGIPLLAGRVFGPEDRPLDDQSSTRSIIVSKEFAHRYFNAEDPLGKRLRWGGSSSRFPWAVVIGVVGDIREDGMDKPPQPYVYFCEEQLGLPNYVIIRAKSGDTMALVPAVRQAIRRADQKAAIYRVLKMGDIVRDSAWKLNYSMLLLGSLAVIALVLAIVGVYGVLSYSVRQRTQEIGVRMALGAERGQVVSMVLREGLTLALAGVAAGLVLSAGLTRFLQTLLFGVAPIDPLTFLIVALALLAAAAGASSLPAFRAAKLDPMNALRHE